jgi:outer membrane protein
VKNLSLIINVVLAIAVAALFYLRFKDKQDEAAPAPVTVEAKGKPIVYVNVDSLLTKYEYFKDVRKVLESRRFQLENDLQTRGKSLQNEVAFFQQRAPSMTQEQGRATEAALQKKQQDIIAFRDQSAQRLQAEEQSKNEELYNRIAAYLKKYNKQNKYEFVLGYTKGGGILFADASLDATKRILDGLNAEYKQQETAQPKK